MSLIPNGPTQVDQLGNPDAAERTKVSMVLEGGGGKGMAYATAIEEFRNGLNKAGVDVDEYAGNSAGAITALLLASGYTPQEMGKLMEELDFTKFNSDAFWLMGGVDPKVRGLDRTGLFSQQKMYKTLHSLISKKLGVEGRPVLFRDLPFKLSVTATVMNSDLDKNDPIRQFDEDGRMVMSSGATPNFDVVGAVIASAAVPLYFTAPQMQIARDQEEAEHKRIQHVDGGVVDNFPISTTSREEDGSTALVVMPVFSRARTPRARSKV